LLWSTTAGHGIRLFRHQAELSFRLPIWIVGLVCERTAQSRRLRFEIVPTVPLKHVRRQGRTNAKETDCATAFSLRNRSNRLAAL